MSVPDPILVREAVAQFKSSLKMIGQRFPNETPDIALHRAIVDAAEAWLEQGNAIIIDNIEPMVRLYADWHGTDWSDDEGMEATRRQVRLLLDALSVEGDQP